MHFTGIVERPNNPNQVMFLKQGQPDKLNREYSNSKYQNMTDSVSFYDAFQRQMAIGSNEQRMRPRLGGAGGDIEFSGHGERIPSDDAYGQSDARSLRLGSGKNSLMGSHAAYFNNTQATRPEREQEMWRDFAKHFANRKRRMTPQNHHDFLDVIRN